ncbi:MAG: YbjQ family protein [Geminicoccaceae bacterium]
MISAILLSEQVLGPIIAILLFFAIGRAVEAAHYRRLRKGEAELAGIPIYVVRDPPEDWTSTSDPLVTGSAVISVDYFKRFLASLRMIFGGRINAYETLVDRARREAVLRLKRAALAQGADVICNLKFETSRVFGGSGGTISVEVLAYGTALKRGVRPD